MRTMPVNDYPLSKWQSTGRPRMPYKIEPLRIIGSRHAVNVSVGVGADEVGEEDLTADVLLSRILGMVRGSAPEAPVTDDLFLLEPIMTPLLHLKAGDEQSFLQFVARYGLGEFIDWAFEEEIDAWDHFFEYYQDGVREFEQSEIERAWLAPKTVKLFTSRQEFLSEVAKDAAEFDTEGSLSFITGAGLEVDAFAIDLEIESHDGAVLVYEKPRHIFARAWFELLDAGSAGLRPRACAHCGRPFAPKREGQSYCPGFNCRDLAYRKRYDKTPYRREYLRKYRQLKREKITIEEWDNWREANPGPGGWKTNGKVS